MSFLSDIQTALAPLGVPIETGHFTQEAPDAYLVVVPMIEQTAYFADNKPQVDVEEARIALYVKGNYQQLKKQVINALSGAGFTITERRYIGYEPESGYHHYSVDTANYYETEE